MFFFISQLVYTSCIQNGRREKRVKTGKQQNNEERESEKERKREGGREREKERKKERCL